MPQIKLCSWNVNGIRAVAKKGFTDWLNDSGFDIVCLQETKVQRDQLDDNLLQIDKYPYHHFNSALRKGYSGVANYFKQEPLIIKDGFDLSFNKLPYKIDAVNQGKSTTTMSYAGLDVEIMDDYQGLLPKVKNINLEELQKQITDFNSEGRVISSEHQLDSKNEFILFNIYFPNGGASVERLKFKLEFYELFLLYIAELEKTNPYIIVTGDYNTAHHDIDLARPAENTNTSGFMPVERLYLDRFEQMGYIDTYRHFYPDKVDSYTWWSFRTAARARNVGWRIDYFYVSKALKPYLQAAQILDQVAGSDHCPVAITLTV